MGETHTHAASVASHNSAAWHFQRSGLAASNMLLIPRRDIKRRTTNDGMKNHKQKAGGLVQRRVNMATRNPKREKCQQTISTRGSMKVHAARMTE